MTMFTRIARSSAAVAMIGAVAASPARRPAAAAPDPRESMYTRALGAGARAARRRRAARRSRRCGGWSRDVRDRGPPVIRRAATATTRSGRAPTSPLLAFERFGNAADRRTAVRLLTLLRDEYPSSSLPTAGRPRQLAARSDAPRPAAIARRLPPAGLVAARWLDSSSPPSRWCRRAPSSRRRRGRPHRRRRDDHASIKRTPLPDGVRVSIEIDGEIALPPGAARATRAACSSICKGARPSPALQDATLKFADDIVREIRLGRHPAEHDPRRHGHGRRSTATASSRSTTRSAWSSTSSAAATAASRPRRARSRRRPPAAAGAAAAGRERAGRGR